MTAPLAVKAVLIDLDGTLLDTVPDLHAAANAMLREVGRPEASIDAVRSYVGRGIPNLVKRCLAGRVDVAEDDTPPPPDALAAFRKHYAAVNGRRATIYPGVREGLAAFKAKGQRLACITNKAEAFALPLLAQTGLAPFFDAIVCGDTLPRCKPDPMPLIWICGHFDLKPHDMLLIGDSVNDAKAARAAGCPVFLVPYGYNEGQDVRDLDGDAIVATLSDAAQLISPA